MRAPKFNLRTAIAAGLVAGTAMTGVVAVSASADTAPAAVAPMAAPASPLLKIAQGLPKKVTANEVIKLAQAQVGQTENGSGGGTKFHDWYMKSQRALETIKRDGGSIGGYRNAPWCDMFISWLGEESGIRPVMGWDAYTVTHAKWFKDNKRWGTKPTPGAVVFFAWSGSKSISAINHVGLVVKDNGNGTVQTVEGNTGGGKVEVRNRPTSDIVGYGYPVYAA